MYYDTSGQRHKHTLREAIIYPVLAISLLVASIEYPEWPGKLIEFISNSCYSLVNSPQETPHNSQLSDLEK